MSPRTIRSSPGSGRWTSTRAWTASTCRSRTRWRSARPMTTRSPSRRTTGPARARGPRRRGGRGGGLRPPAGGLADFSAASVNSRRLAVYAPDGISAPTVNVGDHFAGPVEGIMTEYEGNPELDLTASVAGVSHGLTPQVAPAPKDGQRWVATHNLDNLAPTTAASKFASLGKQVVTNLRSPDILAVQEIQDNDGATDDGVVAANVALADLVSAIQAAGGPTYSWTGIDPVNDQDGGAPGGNIRQVF